jgi:hypothetical protein
VVLRHRYLGLITPIAHDSAILFPWPRHKVDPAKVDIIGDCGWRLLGEHDRALDQLGPTRS